MTTLKQIHEYLIKQGVPEENLKSLDSTSVSLSMEIMEYAHRGQKRVNGEDYANHPMSVLGKYRELVGIVEGDPFCVDEELMRKLRIPYEGVQEVAILHDVVEDTEITLDNLQAIFDEAGLGLYFKTWVKEPLRLVTHIKEVDYSDYIDICMQMSASAMVKMIDLQDNMNILSLTEFGDFEYKRCKKYLKYAKRINDKFHFIENAVLYKKLFNKN